MGGLPSYSVEQTFGKTEWIYLNGVYVPWEKAKVHVLSPAFQYAALVFEGIRAYRIGDNIIVFRLRDHLKRLFDSAEAYYMDIRQYHKVSNWELECQELIRRNRGKGTYLRPFIYRMYGELGVNVLPCEPDFGIAYWDWGKYLGEEALENGVRLEISPFRRMPADVLPATAKAAGNYANGQLAKAHAIMHGYPDAILLDGNGNICEGTGMNLFFVRDGVLWTPPVSACILEGCNRDTVVWLAREVFGMTVREEPIPAMFFHRCDEMFATGAASEVTPVVGVEKFTIGDGNPGPVTKNLQQAFFDLIFQRQNLACGRVIRPPDPSWITYVDVSVDTLAAVAR